MSARTTLQLMSQRLPTSRFTGRPIYIYAFVSPSGVVVYVGRTCDPATRIGAHRVKAAWWTPNLEFAVVDVAYSWPEAVAMEREAIGSLAPVANIQHTGRAAA